MYDLAIIGGGAAGIACAKAALRKGLKTALIEKDETAFGGTCLNRGCIPTKLFINYSKLGKSWEQAFEQKEKAVAQIKTSLLSFLKKGSFDLVWGSGCFCDKNTIAVENKKVQAKNIIIATGAKSKSIFDDSRLVFAKDLFSRQFLPDKILVIGAGYIGLELGCLFQKLGKSALIIEKEKDILLSFDRSLANRLKIILERAGLRIQTEQDINQYAFDNFDIIVSAVGSSPNTESLKLETIGLISDENGWIKTDKSMKTSVENIYACGDVSGKKLLAYVAEYQAGICIDNLMGGLREEDYWAIPETVFSQPSVAQVGMLEKEANDKGIKHRVLRSNFLAYSSSYAYDDKNGFIKILINEKEQIIGAGVISQAAGELINTLSLCVKNRLALSDLKKCVFVHPTLSEIITLLVNSD